MRFRRDAEVEVTLICGCVTNPETRAGGTDFVYRVVAYGEFVCPHAHVVGDRIDTRGRLVVNGESL